MASASLRVFLSLVAALVLLAAATRAVPVRLLIINEGDKVMQETVKFLEKLPSEFKKGEVRLLASPRWEVFDLMNVPSLMQDDSPTTTTTTTTAAATTATATTGPTSSKAQVAQTGNSGSSGKQQQPIKPSKEEQPVSSTTSPVATPVAEPVLVILFIGHSNISPLGIPQVFEDGSHEARTYELMKQVLNLKRTYFVMNSCNAAPHVGKEKLGDPETCSFGFSTLEKWSVDCQPDDTIKFMFTTPGVKGLYMSPGGGPDVHVQSGKGSFTALVTELVQTLVKSPDGLLTSKQIDNALGTAEFMQRAMFPKDATMKQTIIKKGVDLHSKATVEPPRQSFARLMVCRQPKASASTAAAPGTLVLAPALQSVDSFNKFFTNPFKEEMDRQKKQQ